MAFVQHPLLGSNISLNQDGPNFFWKRVRKSLVKSQMSSPDVSYRHFTRWQLLLPISRLIIYWKKNSKITQKRSYITRSQRSWWLPKLRHRNNYNKFCDIHVRVNYILAADKSNKQVSEFKRLLHIEVIHLIFAKARLRRESLVIWLLFSKGGRHHQTGLPWYLDGDI